MKVSFGFDDDAGLANPHRDALVAEFGSLRPQHPIEPPDLNYVFILFINRCGSNYLSQAMASSGALNEAGEFFNAETILEHSRRCGLGSLQDYFAYLPRLVAHNGHLAAKLAIEHVDLLQEAGIMDAILPRSRFILMERQDRLAHAISRCIAWQNGRWTSLHPSALPDERLVYSRSGIEQQLQYIDQAKRSLYRFLSRIGHAPIHFTYEAFVARPQFHLDEIAGSLGLAGLPLDPSRIHIQRQSNGINETWRDRYLSGA